MYFTPYTTAFIQISLREINNILFPLIFTLTLIRHLSFLLLALLLFEPYISIEETIDSSYAKISFSWKPKYILSPLFYQLFIEFRKCYSNKY